jgi:metallopeptidase MepB
MAKTPKAVLELIEDIRDRVLEGLSDDVQKLLQMKKEESVPNPPPDVDVIHWSDLQYYIRLYEERHHSINQHAIAAHFPIYQTVERMLSLFGRLFGFVFIKGTSDRARTDTLEEELTWHADVVLYSVWNNSREGGGFVGYLYLDLHPRPGKSGGAQCRPLQLGFERSDGKRHYPSTVLLTNFPQPVTEAPSLLQHSDVVLLFHELGHAMHDLAGRCRYSRFHGAETASDFTEAPSQMLENWCWDAESLKFLSGHHATGEPIPDSMIASLIRTRVVLPAAKLLPQLKMTLFDLAVHSSVPSEGSLINVEEIYAHYSEIGGIKSVGNEHGFASYRHLFSGSDALMYGYIWSKVLAMDMFDTLFRHDPLDDTVGRRYRRLILENGGSEEEMHAVIQLLGRNPTSEAFYKSLGL